MRPMSENPILWRPSSERQQATAMYRFMRQHSCSDYAQLHRWSIDELASFWESIGEFCGLQFAVPPQETLVQPGDMTTAKWFVGSELNFAEHLLRGVAKSATRPCARRSLQLRLGSPPPELPRVIGWRDFCRTAPKP